jgi:hypothetical protein
LEDPPRRLGDRSPSRRRRAWGWGSLTSGLLRTLLAIVLAPLGHVAALHAQAAAQPDPASAASPRRDGVVVPAGTRADGVVVLRGELDIYGTVEGSAVAVDDIVVHPGARVTGDVISILGTVRAAGGTVVGQIRAMDGADTPAIGARRVDQPRRAPASTWDNLTVVAGWLVVLLVIGLGVLVTASPYLDGVAEALEVSFARALGVGIVGQMLVLPALLALVVALAITIVGVLAIPLGIVAFVLGVAGLVTLGFLAVAFVTGRSLVGGREGGARRRAAAARGDALRALTLGLLIYLAVWFAAAALSSLPVAAVLLRTVAIGVTWVAATAGFGAALISRAGTRQPKLADEPPRVARPEYGGREPVAAGVGAGERSSVPAWQTPTPITGVVAARRPTPVPPPSSRE